MITFPEEPGNGQQVIDESEPNVVVIWTYNESENEWTYQRYGSQEPVRVYSDQVIIRENEVAGLATDPAELKTQKDVNHFLAEMAESGGGGPSLDTLPWISIKRFRCDLEGRSELPVFYATTEVNPLANYFWRWDVDLYNSGNWKDVDDFDSSEQAYFPISMQMEGYLKLTSQTNDRYPNARIRYVVWVENFDGKSSELASSEESTFVDTAWDRNYEPPLFTDGEGGATVDYASREYVDQQVASIPPIPPVDHLISKDGESTVGSDFRLKQDKIDGSGKNNYLAIHSDYLYLYHVAPPTSDHHGVNRKYVDDKIAALEARIAALGG